MAAVEPIRVLNYGSRLALTFATTKEAVAQTCSVKKVFLEISQNSQENTCARASFLIKLQATLIWKQKFVKD